MSLYFKRQLADYVEYHRDPWNGVMHVFGIISLFLAAMLPLSLWPVPGLGGQITLAPLLAVPVLVYWMLLDAALGTAILGAAVILLVSAAAIVTRMSIVGVWSITAVLIIAGVTFQVVGHSVFERRKASMADNPTHLLLGPLFVMAKLFIAFGFRSDLAAIITPAQRLTNLAAQPYRAEAQGEPLQLS